MNNAEKHYKYKVGEIRPSQLLFTYGIGAIVDLPEIAVIVMGLEDWSRQPDTVSEIVEDRLLTVVRRVAGYQVNKFFTPPAVIDSDWAMSPFDEMARIGAPVATFPRWMVCPSCQFLASLESGLFELKPDLYHPDRTRYVHSNCNKAKKPPTVVPARFLVACENGHLDDFPWVEFVHRNSGICQTPLLRLFERTPSGEARDLYVRCESCGQSQQLSGAFGQANREKMPRCRGRRPHLRDYDEDGCDRKMRTIVLGASNLWFPVVFTSIAVPTASVKIDQLVQENWAMLQFVANKGALAFPRGTGQLGELAKYSDDEIWEAIERRRDEISKEAGEEESEEPSNIKEPEWRVFTQATPDVNSSDFRLRPVDVPSAYMGVIDSVILVERMREVRAIAGFTRIDSPGEFSEPGAGDEIENIATLSRKPPTWVPAVEVRGEGIFIQFNEGKVESWLQRDSVVSQNAAFFDTHVRWRDARFIADPLAHYPGIRYVMLHTFAHTLMRQLAMEAGYSAASLRERIYSQNPEDPGGPMAGILIYTAATDSEGTLGGLVKLGEPQTLERHIQAALETASLCASDPICAETPPDVGGISLHAAACHACLFVPETSCERGNKYLGRSVLVPTFAHDDRAFFDI